MPRHQQPSFAANGSVSGFNGVPDFNPDSGVRQASRSQSNEGFFAPVSMQGNVNSFGQRDGSPAQLAGSLPSFDQHYPQDIRPNTGNSQMIDSLSMNHFSNQNTGGGSDQASLDENVSTLQTPLLFKFLN